VRLRRDAFPNRRGSCGPGVACWPLPGVSRRLVQEYRTLRCEKRYGQAELDSRRSECVNLLHRDHEELRRP
jgi:hypothetical protein